MNTSAASSEVLQVPTLTDETVRVLRERLLAGDFAPGERLREEQLSERFGVSRPPLREALRILSREGLLESRPRRGYTVVDLSMQEIRDLYDFRFSLEKSAVELALPLEDPTSLAPMLTAVQLMRRKSVQRDQAAMVKANSEFHSGLVGLPGNRWLSEAYRMVSQQIEFFMAMNLRFRQESANDPQDAARRHQVLVDLILEGDVDAVVAALADHGSSTFLDISTN